MAYKLKKENPHFISIGERKGLKLPGFDYGNSPAEIANVDMHGKTVILTTSAGTQGIAQAVNASEIITGAFVNAGAVAAYIRKQKPKQVSFVCTNDRYKDNEDDICAKYLKSCLEDKPLDFQKIKQHLINHPTAEGFLRKPMTEYSERDFYLSLDLNRFNFVIKVKRKKVYFLLEKLQTPVTL